MRTFNATEKNLCKKVAEKWRKDYTQGDWILDSNDKPWLIAGVELWKFSRPGLEHTMAYDLEPVDRTEDAVVVLHEEEIKRYIPLWQEHDCLEFLRKQKGFRCYFVDHANHETTTVCMEYWDGQKKTIIKKCKTLLESLLKTVLAVMEKKEE